MPNFYRAPKAEGETEYDLANGELVTDILLPPAGQLRSATYEIRQRRALDWPLAAAAVTLGMSGDMVTSARVVLGHVAPTPWQAPSAAEALVGKTLDAEVAARAAEAATEGARPLSQNGYKVSLARVAVRRAVSLAVGMEI